MIIEQTARGTAKDMGSNSNVEATVVSLKRLNIGPGKTKRAARERWSVEFEGLGNTEIVVAIPASINRLKDQGKRDAKVRALVKKTVRAEGIARLAAHL